MQPWLAGLVAIGVLGLGLAGIRSALFVVRVDGPSMLPTFRSGDAVLALRRRLRPRVRRGDIVVCRLPAGVPGPDALLIKRVTAVGGDDEPAGVVPAGVVFVRGDGPGSYDSRQFGPIPLDHVVGHVLARLSLRT